LFLFAILWHIVMPKIAKDPNRERKHINSQHEGNRETEKMTGFVCGVKQSLLKNGIIYVVLGCFCIGFLRESVSLWIPSYISDTFQLNSSFSIILTVLVPGLQICGAILGGKIGEKMYQLHVPCAVAFGISGISLLFLMMCGGNNLLITMLLFVINAICMTAALTFYLSLYPIRFIEKDKVAVFVGVFNFSVHMGDFIASSGIGWCSQNYGWSSTFGILGCIALLAFGVCICALKNRKKVTIKNEKKEQ